MANGSDIDFDKDLLRNRITELRALVKNPRSTPKQKLDMVLLNQEIVLMVVLNDHPRVPSMWGAFRPMAWGMSIAAAGVIGLAISGHISIAVLP